MPILLKIAAHLVLVDSRKSQKLLDIGHFSKSPLRVILHRVDLQRDEVLGLYHRKGQIFKKEQRSGPGKYQVGGFTGHIHEIYAAEGCHWVKMAGKAFGAMQRFISEGFQKPNDLLLLISPCDKIHILSRPNIAVSMERKRPDDGKIDPFPRKEVDNSFNDRCEIHISPQFQPASRCAPVVSGTTGGTPAELSVGNSHLFFNT